MPHGEGIWRKSSPCHTRAADIYLDIYRLCFHNITARPCITFKIAVRSIRTSIITGQEKGNCASKACLNNTVFRILSDFFPAVLVRSSSGQGPPQRQGSVPSKGHPKLRDVGNHQKFPIRGDLNDQSKAEGISCLVLPRCLRLCALTQEP